MKTTLSLLMASILFSSIASAKSDCFEFKTEGKVKGWDVFVVKVPSRLKKNEISESSIYGKRPGSSRKIGGSFGCNLESQDESSRKILCQRDDDGGEFRIAVSSDGVPTMKFELFDLGDPEVGSKPVGKGRPVAITGKHCR